MLAPDLDTCFRYHVEHTVVLLVELAVELDLQPVVSEAAVATVDESVKPQP